MTGIRSLYHGLNKISDIAQKLLEAVLAVLVLVCAADLLLQVVYRFVLVHFVSFTCSWTTEFAQDALVWMTYLAVGICFKENSMASVNLVFDKLKGQAKMGLYLITRVLVILFLLIGLKYGWASIASVSNWTSTNLHLPGYILYGAPFLGCILMLYEVVVEMLGTLCGELLPFAGRAPVSADEAEMAEQQAVLTESEQKHTGAETKR